MPAFCVSKKNSVAVLAAVCLAGCSSLPPVSSTSILPGATLQEVLSRFGNPAAIQVLPGGKRLQYSTQPAGQTAVMVDLNTDDKVTSARQVLNPTDFARVVPGQWTKDDILREYGRPAAMERVGNWAGDILVYRWLNVFDPMLFYVYLDASQKVQQTGTGMEQRREPWK